MGRPGKKKGVRWGGGKSSACSRQAAMQLSAAGNLSTDLAMQPRTWAWMTVAAFFSSSSRAFSSFCSRTSFRKTQYPGEEFRQTQREETASPRQPQQIPCLPASQPRVTRHGGLLFTLGAVPAAPPALPFRESAPTDKGKVEQGVSAQPPHCVQGLGGGGVEGEGRRRLHRFYNSCLTLFLTQLYLFLR